MVCPDEQSSHFFPKNIFLFSKSKLLAGAAYCVLLLPSAVQQHRLQANSCRPV